MKINSHIALSDTGLIVNPFTGESFTVNEIGLTIIKMLNKNESKSKIKKEILSNYHVDEITFEKDYSDFIRLLKQYQLIEDTDNV